MHRVIVLMNLDPHNHDTVRLNTLATRDAIARAEEPMLTSVFLIDVLTA